MKTQLIQFIIAVLLLSSCAKEKFDVDAYNEALFDGSWTQVYGETVINKTESFLLPHSSFLSFIVFFGIFGVFYIFYLLTKMYKRNFDSIFAYGNMILIFIALNIIKNDGLNYLPSSTLYLFLCFVILKSKSEEVFIF